MTLKKYLPNYQWAGGQYLSIPILTESQVLNVFFIFHTHFLKSNNLIEQDQGQDIKPGGLGGDLFLYAFDQIDNSCDMIKNFSQSSGDKLAAETGINFEADSGFTFLSYLGFEVKVDNGNHWDSENIIEYANAIITEI